MATAYHSISFTIFDASGPFLASPKYDSENLGCGFNGQIVGLGYPSKADSKRIKI
jgi:hypothetical protein